MNIMKWIITIVLCLVVLGALSAYKIMEIRAGIAAGEAYPEQSETVEDAVVASAEFLPTIALMGEVVAPRQLDLRNEIAGEISAVNFQSGAEVSQGQLLLQLDISIEEANLNAAKARAELARLDYERNQELLESRLVNEESLDRARANLSTALAEISVLERTIGKKTLRAPFAGRAGLHSFEVGQYLPVNTLITTLVGATENMWIDFQVPQFYPQLPIGAEVEITRIDNSGITTGVRRNTIANVIAENTILDAGSRSRAYRASINNESGFYAPRLMVRLEAPIESVQTLLQVPSVSVQSDPLGQYVFVLKNDPAGKGHRAMRQRVQVRVVEDGYALLERDTGLNEGDKIAADGAFKLYEGILVMIGERPSQGEASLMGQEVP